MFWLGFPSKFSQNQTDYEWNRNINNTFGLIGNDKQTVSSAPLDFSVPTF